ncbi:Hypothetical predicted protein, partial [Paramuricea clavata]
MNPRILLNSSKALTGYTEKTSLRVKPNVYQRLTSLRPALAFLTYQSHSSQSKRTRRQTEKRQRQK